MIVANKRVHGQKKWLLGVIKCLISGGLLFWAVRSTELTEVFQAVSSAQLYFLVGAFIAYGVSYYIRSYRWRVLLKAHKVKAKVTSLWQSYMVSIFFGHFLPSTIGGDIIRGYDAWRLGASKSVAATTVFLDRFLGLIALLFFAMMALILSQELTTRLPLLLFGLLVVIGGIVLVSFLLFKYSEKISQLISQWQLPYLNKIKESGERLINALLAFGKHPNALIQGLAWSGLVQITVITHFYLVAKAMGFTVPFLTYFIIIPLATLITMLPLSINGIGIRENAFVFLFGIYGYGIDRAEAVAFAWLAYGITVIQGLVGGIIYALRK